jgi:uncharacterized lipoprotein YmbA
MKLLTVLLLALLTACAGQTTSTHQYLLRSNAVLESRQHSDSSGIVLETVIVAAYLDQPGLVLETQQSQINQARHHRWAEPLRQSLRQFFATEIAADLGTDISLDRFTGNTAPTLIRIVIDQLHGNAQGEAILQAYWEISKDETTHRFQFSKTRGLVEDGYPALVQSEKALLSQLAQAIADSLR